MRLQLLFKSAGTENTFILAVLILAVPTFSPPFPHLYSAKKCLIQDSVKMSVIAEAPWSEAEWAVALLFVDLLQAQLGRQVAY